MLTVKIVSEWLGTVDDIDVLEHDGDARDYGYTFGDLLALVREAEPVMRDKYKELRAKEALKLAG